MPEALQIVALLTTINHRTSRRTATPLMVTHCIESVLALSSTLNHRQLARSPRTNNQFPVSSTTPTVGYTNYITRPNLVNLFALQGDGGVQWKHRRREPVLPVGQRCPSEVDRSDWMTPPVPLPLPE